MIRNGKKLNAIIVDDIPEFVAGLKFFLEVNLNCNVIGVVAGGSELLNHELLPYSDFVLIDCEMPGMNGIETARLVNYRSRSTKMIALTMSQDKVSILDLIGAGFSACVFKPDIVIKLESVIKKVLNNEFDFSKELRIY